MSYFRLIFRFNRLKFVPKIIFLSFEFLQNLSVVVEKVAKFLGKKFSSSEIDALCNHLSFDNMKNNPAVNKDSLTEMVRNINNVEAKGTFIRKGAVGQWKTDLNQDVIECFAKWEFDNLKNANVTYANL